MNRRQFCTAAAAAALAACAKPPRTQKNRATVFIIHGYGATADDHWFPWLHTQLAQQGIRTVRVPLPDSGQPDFDRWQQTLAQYIGKPSANDVFVAHSLGTVSLLHYLTATQPRHIGGLVLVSAFGKRIPALPAIGGFNVDAYIDRCRIDFAAVARMTRQIELFAADNDSIVPADNTRYVADQLHGHLHILAKGGHFLDRDGFTEFPPVLAAVAQMVGRLPA
ncbi:RBBP9/YdeN family alpha/beta hydrolase [Kingella potus]|uniref:RBBP9/YdeN family alpha/beta hydrolase n=1 Tax=Kingella potus TaxID=265175 RepID=UPI000E1B863C|nr:alpha/beta fold hydrolase [Kingella potus]UOP01648.1 alpha/beta hydrolase [Kingella potus]